MNSPANIKHDIVSASPVLIELKNISMVYDRRPVLENINLSISKGDFIAITGPNGGGKTTLMRIILKLLKPTSGIVNYYHDIKPGKGLNIGYLPQKNMIDSHFPITVRQVITSGLLNAKEPLSEKEAQVNRVVEMVGLTDNEHAAIGTLSGGQLQRTLLGRALVSSPAMLVLDEPLSYIDKRFEAKIYDIISHVAQQTTIVLVSHEMSKIAAMANRHLIVNRTLTQCSATHHYFRSNCIYTPEI